MAKKYYAVRKGLTPGIYFTWADCKKNVDGFPGAEYKGFDNLQEAENFLKMNSQEKTVLDSGTFLENEAVSIDSSDGAIAYVDGSFNVATGEYSYGAVIFYDGKEEHLSRKFSDPVMSQMRNVAGEIKGSMCAMTYCIEHKIKKITIYYDYEGIEKWCTGAWKANKEGTIAYREFYKKACEQVKIQFVKVKGHSGDKYNDLADSLAKQALGIE